MNKCIYTCILHKHTHTHTHIHTYIQLEDFIPGVEEFYKKKHNGRKLTWHHVLSNGSVSLHAPSSSSSSSPSSSSFSTSSSPSPSSSSSLSPSSSSSSSSSFSSSSSHFILVPQITFQNQVGKYELEITTFQMAVLFTWNQRSDDRISFDSLR